MAKKKDNILSKRLASLSSQKPVDWTPPPSAAPKERPKRVEDRKPAYRFARLILGDRSEVKCIIRDFSSRGMRVVLEGSHPLPPHLTVKIDQTGQSKKAAVVWQKELEAGLCFDA
jgi:hypothetical protein